MSSTTIAQSSSSASDDSLSHTQIVSMVATGVITAILTILAWYAARHDLLWWLALSVGGLGGLLHEIAQSGGKILFFAKKADGFYFGSLAGMALGAVAGLLTIRAFWLDPALLRNTAEIAYEALLAGLSLKGIAEAAGGQALPSNM